MISFQRPSDREKRAINVHWYHGMSVADIARIIVRHLSTVSTYSRAPYVQKPTKKMRRSARMDERLKRIIVKRAVLKQKTASTINKELRKTVSTQRVQYVLKGHSYIEYMKSENLLHKCFIITRSS